MRIIGFDNQIAIPADKIVEIIIDQEHKNKVTIWLEGGFVQTITNDSEEKAADVFNTIKKELESI